VLAASGLDWHVPALVRLEVGKIRQPDPDDPTRLVEAAIELQPFFDGGVLRPCDAHGEGETELFVQIAAALDDGEAMALTIAAGRGWALATDDRKAIREAARRGASTLGTPELVKQWADTAGAPENAIARTLRNIQTFARFQPRRGSPLYQWWSDLAARAPS
jgi:hypothetical protein